MSEHNFVYDPHCSRCGADGSEIDTECPGDTILTAAHRAGAIEALDWLISQYQQQIGVIKQHREYYATGGSVEYVNVMNQELSALRNARWTAIVAKSRYAEPGEEKKG